MITNKPYAVWWLVGGVHHAMKELKPAEFDRIAERNHDLLGVPRYWTIFQDDVEWWPQFKEGEPVVVLAEASVRR
jgi:hypothetical protein